MNDFMEEFVWLNVRRDDSPKNRPGWFLRLLIWLKVRNAPRINNVICVGVNGVNQPIMTGMEQAVKRKYVEALARTVDEDGMHLAHPFIVTKDTDAGISWLKGVLQEVSDQA